MRTGVLNVPPQAADPAPEFRFVEAERLLAIPCKVEIDVEPHVLITSITVRGSSHPAAV
jgi:hypothetical protein